MHGLLVTLARLQTLTNLRSYIISLAVILIAALTFWSLGADIWLVNLAAILVVAATLAVGVYFFLQAPSEWAIYLFHKMIYLFASLLASSIRFISYSIAAILSLIYFLWPIDFVPDVILFIGWIEDIAIAFGLFAAARSAQHSMPNIDVDFDPFAQGPRLIFCVVVGIVRALFIRSLAV